jgi:hypothetical protein
MQKRVRFRATDSELKKTEQAKEQIFVVRGQRVMLDRDLARLYGIATKRLNEQLRRNRRRFPNDFAFRLTLGEAKEIRRSRSQNATLNRGENTKYAPYVFTEHGAIMLASVLSSKTAVQASIYVVRAFVQMRAAILGYADLSRRIDELAAKYDQHFQQVFVAIRSLMKTPEESRQPIGFISSGKGRKRKQ